MENIKYYLCISRPGRAEGIPLCPFFLSVFLKKVIDKWLSCVYIIFIIIHTKPIGITQKYEEAILWQILKTVHWI